MRISVGKTYLNGYGNPRKIVYKHDNHPNPYMDQYGNRYNEFGTEACYLKGLALIQELPELGVGHNVVNLVIGNQLAQFHAIVAVEV